MDRVTLPSPHLPAGLYLFWRYDGKRTLSQFLRSPLYPMASAPPRPRTPSPHIITAAHPSRHHQTPPPTSSSPLPSPLQNLAEALFGSDLAYSFAEPELPVAQLVLEQVLKSLLSLHSSGIVHRDVKPLNLVLSEREKAFKLIDLGACADLRTGKNFVPDETILDPKYSPPEEFIMPIDAAPDLAKVSAPVALALGAASWARYQPDRFDTYSAGVLFMQMAIPTLRSDKGLKASARSPQRRDGALAVLPASAFFPLLPDRDR